MDLLEGIFRQMLREIETDYPNKFDLLRNYVQIILQEALKFDPLPAQNRLAANGTRTCELFLELLERQFPILSPSQRLQLRTANEFAGQLSVHTNHLNRVLRKVTGKTTSEHIADRLLLEARSMLLHTDWDVAQIAFCLGFGHASNFNAFFKKQSGETPRQIRRKQVSIS